MKKRKHHMVYPPSWKVIMYLITKFYSKEILTFEPFPKLIWPWNPLSQLRAISISYNQCSADTWEILWWTICFCRKLQKIHSGFLLHICWSHHKGPNWSCWWESGHNFVAKAHGSLRKRNLILNTCCIISQISNNNITFIILQTPVKELCCR